MNPGSCPLYSSESYLRNIVLEDDYKDAILIGCITTILIDCTAFVLSYLLVTALKSGLIL